MRQSPLSALGLAIIGFCAWQSTPLGDAWRSSPFDRFGWLAFVIWAIPVFCPASVETRLPLRPTQHTALQGSALALALLGSLGSLNGLCYIGLACSMAALCPWGPRTAVWLAGAISWMPVFGYAMSQCLPNSLPNTAFVVSIFRLTSAVVATSILLLPMRKKNQIQ